MVNARTALQHCYNHYETDAEHEHRLRKNIEIDLQFCKHNHTMLHQAAVAFINALDNHNRRETQRLRKLLDIQLECYKPQT